MTGQGQHVAPTLRLRYREGEGSLTHSGEFGDIGALGYAQAADWRALGLQW